MTSPPPPGVAARVAPAVAAVVVLVVSLVEASPGLGPLDAGDFVAASAALGVPHPTGFPVQTATGAGAQLLPLGAIAARAAWWSAMMSAVAALLWAWIGGRLARTDAGRLAAACAVGAAFVTVDTLALHARMPEAYATNVALAGAALLLVIDHARAPDLRRVAVAGVLVGLGITHHALWRPWALVLVVAAVATTPPGLRRRAAAIVAMAAGAALLAWAWLPAAALSDASHAWGQPDTWARWWDHVNAASIRRGHDGAMWPGPYAAWVHLTHLVEQLARGLGGLAPAGLVAGAALVWRDRRAAGAVLAVAAVDGAYAAWINPMGLSDVQNGQALALALAVAAGVGLGDALSVVAARLVPHAGGSRATGVAGVAATAALLALARPGPWADLQRDHSSEDLVLAHLHAAAPDSITTWGSDTLAAAGLYARVVLDARPDTWTIGRWALSDPAVASARAAASPFAVTASPVEPPGFEASLNLWMHGILGSNLPQRAVYHEVAGDDADLPGGVVLEHRWPVGVVRIGDGGPVTACAPASHALCGPADDAAWGAGARAVSGAQGVWYRRWLAAQWGRIGNVCVRRGDLPCAGQAFERARGLAPDRVAHVNGLALVLASTGRLDAALDQIDVALEVDPLSAVALRNGALYASAAGDRDRFDRYARRAERLGVALPDDARRPR